jgi:hypothetical protein
MPRRRVVLRWEAVACAESYRVIVSERVSGAVVADESGLTELQYRTGQLERGKRYRWQVIAVNGYGEGASEERPFRISPEASQE